MQMTKQNLKLTDEEGWALPMKTKIMLKLNLTVEGVGVIYRDKVETEADGRGSGRD